MIAELWLPCVKCGTCDAYLSGVLWRLKEMLGKQHLTNARCVISQLTTNLHQPCGACGTPGLTGPWRHLVDAACQNTWLVFKSNDAFSNAEGAGAAW